MISKWKKEISRNTFHPAALCIILILGWQITRTPVQTTGTPLLDSKIPYDVNCLQALPEWVLSDNPDILGGVFRSVPATDKATKHKYQHMYHRYLSKIAMRTCHKYLKNEPIRILEIGLGCSKSVTGEVPEEGAGMLKGQPPGGSVEAWRKIFPVGQFRVHLDLHIMEFDTVCAKTWMDVHSKLASVHTGDATSITDIKRVYEEAGGLPFDVIIDDGSHINEHQISTFEHMINYVKKGGVYFIEDIHSSCKGWPANTGGHVSGFRVKGTEGCMETEDGKPTIFSKLVEWMKPLLTKKEPFDNVINIDISYQGAIIGK